MPKMRAGRIARPGSAFEIVERDIPQPAADWVRIKVQACGICHSDSLVKEGHWPGLQFLRVPGHMIHLLRRPRFSDHCTNFGQESLAGFDLAAAAPFEI